MQRAAAASRPRLKRIAFTFTSRSARRSRTPGSSRTPSSTTSRATVCGARGVGYDADWNTRAGAAHEGAVHAGILRARARGAGRAAPDPIFIVGLPRSGSTLLEQILSSHPQVEGTMELPDIVGIVERAGRRPPTRARRTTIRNPSPDWTRAALRALGERYLAQTRIYRKSDCAVLHRQAAEQLRAHRPDPPDPAACEDHRRAPPSARLLLLRLQAALRARSTLHLQPR